MAADFATVFAGKRALVTGGLGFIGSNLAHRLVALGATVTIADARFADCGSNPFNIHELDDRLRVVIGDISDAALAMSVVAGQDFVFNLAGRISHTDSMKQPLADLDANARCHLVLLEACRNNTDARIVYAGTRQVYGRPRYLPVDEAHPVAPADVNGVSKLAGELYHLVYHTAHGLRTTSLRLTNVYGPRQHIRDARLGFVPWFIRLAVDGKTISIFGDGRQRRDLVYVDDAVDAFLSTAASDAAIGQIFNVGGAEPVSLLELTQRIVATAGGSPQTGYKLVPFPDERRAIDIGDFYTDYTKIRRVVGWEPKVSLDDGLRRTIDYYRRFKEHYW